MMGEVFLLLPCAHYLAALLPAQILVIGQVKGLPGRFLTCTGTGDWTDEVRGKVISLAYVTLLDA